MDSHPHGDDGHVEAGGNRRVGRASVVAPQMGLQFVEKFLTAAYGKLATKMAHSLVDQSRSPLPLEELLRTELGGWFGLITILGRLRVPGNDVLSPAALLRGGFLVLILQEILKRPKEERAKPSTFRVGE